MVLEADLGNFLAVIAVVCTSFVGINRGTNQRSILTPYGREDLGFIQEGNCMMERCLAIFKPPAILYVAPSYYMHILVLYGI